MTIHLDHDTLALTHAETLAAPRRHNSLAARTLFVSLDLPYGRARTLEKFRVLELIARVPHQAWEQVAYVASTHVHEQRYLARHIYDRVVETREILHVFAPTDPRQLAPGDRAGSQSLRVGHC
jgi:ubiquinol oxidase